MKMKEWEDLSPRRKTFDVILCVVACFTFCTGLALTDDLIEERARARIAAEETRLRAKEGTVRLTAALPVVSYEFEYHWWGDKVILLVKMNGDLKHHEYKLRTQVKIHKADTEFAYLKFEEKLVRGSNTKIPWGQYTRLFWEKQVPPKAHLYIPTPA